MTVILFRGLFGLVGRLLGRLLYFFVDSQLSLVELVESMTPVVNLEDLQTYLAMLVDPLVELVDF